MGYLVFACKSRPQTFGEVAGQMYVVRNLKNALRQGRLVHAPLFSGIHEVDKTTIAFVPKAIIKMISKKNPL